LRAQEKGKGKRAGLRAERAAEIPIDVTGSRGWKGSQRKKKIMKRGGGNLRKKRIGKKGGGGRLRGRSGVAGWNIPPGLKKKGLDEKRIQSLSKKKKRQDFSGCVKKSLWGES